MTGHTIRCTDRAYDQLLDIYGTDNAVWAAVFAIGEVCEYKSNVGMRALMTLCSAHRIDPDAE